MIKLSVAIITFNEEKNIRRCLESVLEVADEIIVLDSFSTDNTENICREYPVKFFTNKFPGHLEQKNKAAELTSFDHILSLDADEALDDTLKMNIIQLKQNWEKDAYAFKRLTQFCGKWIKHCGWYPDQKFRLWRKGKAMWGGTNPHDKLILNSGSTSGYIEGNLLHYSFYTINDHIDQINKFSLIKARQMHLKGKRFSWWSMFFSVSFKFFKTYFLKRGFLDGFYGFVISVNSAYSNFLKHVKLREISK